MRPEQCPADEPSGSGAGFEGEWFFRDRTLYAAGSLFGAVLADDLLSTTRGETVRAFR